MVLGPINVDESAADTATPAAMIGRQQGSGRSSCERECRPNGVRSKVMPHRAIAVSLAVLSLCLGGCGLSGPSAAELRERTLSTLNVVADSWDGAREFKTDASDAYGRPLVCR